MEYITFESFPDGADLEIEGEPCGQTPADIEMFSDLISFREECMTEGNVSCAWETLKTKLEDQTVSKIWWDLRYEERYSIAYMATSNVLKYLVRYVKRDAGCGFGAATHAGECSSNTAIRLSKFGCLNGCFAESGLCFWKRYPDDEWSNYSDFVCYNLPCYVVSTEPHVMAAIALNKEITVLHDLFVFQYSDIDIQPGGIQLMGTTTLKVYLPEEVWCFGPYKYSEIAVINIEQAP